MPVELTALPHPRFTLFLTVLLLTAGALAPALPFRLAVIVGFDLAALCYIVSVAPLWWSGSPEKIRSSAAQNDGGRGLLLGIAAIASSVIMVALATMVGDHPGLARAEILLVLATLILVWLFANLVFTFHYAHLFYDQTTDGHDAGGLVFPGTTAPVFTDFVYFAYVVGMTSQVSDVAVTSADMRTIVSFHGMLAFFFNFGVLALALSVLAAKL